VEFTEGQQILCKSNRLERSSFSSSCNWDEKKAPGDPDEIVSRERKDRWFGKAKSKEKKKIYVSMSGKRPEKRGEKLAPVARERDKLATRMANKSPRGSQPWIRAVGEKALREREIK